MTRESVGFGTGHHTKYPVRQTLCAKTCFVTSDKLVLTELAHQKGRDARCLRTDPELSAVERLVGGAPVILMKAFALKSARVASMLNSAILLTGLASRQRPVAATRVASSIST